MLIILGGLPGSGKSTIAHSLARKTGACYLRLDTVEQAIRAARPPESNDVGPEGYMALYALASDNLQLGQNVIVDSVNAIEVTRSAFRRVATDVGKGFVEIEIICSDAATHRQRAATRMPVSDGHRLPTWEEIQTRRFERWSPDLRLDSYVLSVEESVSEIINLLNARKE
ncbi:kinase [Xaviernesmea oryzae]|uniref:Kinase n=1 Tax=Xaviernesmea oryzae TaxID=464029 RepID=A0A1Q9AQU3_9HYPH|nr:AAA family ATPase [Xaviernesmea oryzae]OLP57784.1 kinase [Xaviernesmea oryzae]SEL37151.1 Predicted kinase [Xaviernesmea oryzae]